MYKPLLAYQRTIQQPILISKPKAIQILQPGYSKNALKPLISSSFFEKMITITKKISKKFVLNFTQVLIYALIIALFAQKRISWQKTY